MSNNVKGILVGFLMSLIGVAAWILCSAVLEIIAGIAGALMGILFIVGYRIFNKGKLSNNVIIIAGAIVLVEIVVSELIALAIIASANGFTFGEVFDIEGVTSGFAIDLIVGILLSGLVFGFYISDMKRKEKRQEQADQMAQQQNQFMQGQGDPYANPNQQGYNPYAQGQNPYAQGGQNPYASETPYAAPEAVPPSEEAAPAAESDAASGEEESNEPAESTEGTDE